eukprot:Amastigsp_a513201_11.p4 type:complete len:104 gc:universal Amastigsp_a513201_11:429-740(+)
MAAGSSAATRAATAGEKRACSHAAARESGSFKNTGARVASSSASMRPNAAETASGLESARSKSAGARIPCGVQSTSSAAADVSAIIRTCCANHHTSGSASPSS